MLYDPFHFMHVISTEAFDWLFKNVTFHKVVYWAQHSEQKGWHHLKLWKDIFGQLPSLKLLVDKKNWKLKWLISLIGNYCLLCRFWWNDGRRYADAARRPPTPRSWDASWYGGFRRLPTQPDGGWAHGARWPLCPRPTPAVRRPHGRHVHGPDDVSPTLQCPPAPTSWTSTRGVQLSRVLWWHHAVKNSSSGQVFHWINSYKM